MHCLCVMILLQSQYETQEWEEEKNWRRKAIKLPFPVNKQHSTYTIFLCAQFIFFVLVSLSPSLSLSLYKCQMHTDDDVDMNVHKILPTVSSKQRKNSEFGFAHMICVPCDVSLSLPYMSLNKYCLNEKVNSCGCTVLGCRCFFLSLLSFNPNSSSASLCVPGVLVPMNRYCYRLNGLYSSRWVFALFIQYTRVWWQMQTLAHKYRQYWIWI